MTEILLLLEEAVLKPDSAILITILLIVFSSISSFLLLKKQGKPIKDMNCDNFYARVGWLLSLLLGIIIYQLLNVKLIVILVALSCITKEFKEIVNNLKALGVDITEAEEIYNELEKR